MKLCGANVQGERLLSAMALEGEVWKVHAPREWLTRRGCSGAPDLPPEREHLRVGPGILADRRGSPGGEMLEPGPPTDRKADLDLMIYDPVSNTSWTHGHRPTPAK